MKRILLLLLFSFAMFAQVMAQCGGTILTVNNPSFEGTPAPHVTPPGWDICMPGVTPDTQPGSWGQVLAPSNGSSYLGLVHAPSFGWQEGAGQTLSSPMIASTSYNFTIDLAVPASADPLTGILVPPHCVQLQCWGGMSGINSGCDQSELLWTSPSVTNTTWQTYNLSFTPTSNWDHILFVIWTIPPPCTDGQYIFVDNMTPIVPVGDIALFTATTVCEGSATQFTDSSSSITGTITDWTWDFDDGSPGSTQQNPSHIFAAAGTYNVSLTIITNVPCTTTVVLPVTVNPLPAVTISSDAPAVCVGQSSANLTANGADTYQWSHGLGTGNPVNVNPVATTTYTVTGTSLGCTNTATISILASVVSASGSITDNISCYGEGDGEASITVNSGTAPFSYLWSPSGGIGSSASNLSAGTYTVIVTDSLGCIDTVTILMNEPAELLAEITDSTHIECNGASTGSATVSVSGGTPPYSYLWMPAGGTGATASNIPSGTYQVTITDDNGCTAYALVTLQQPPAVTINITSQDEQCPGSCDGLASVLATGGSPPYTYQWNTTPPQAGQGITDLCAGNYTIQVTDNNNCIFTNIAIIGTSADATAYFSAYPEEGVIPLNVQFTYTGTGAASWSWDFGDGATSALPDPSHTYTVNGIYTVMLIVTSGPPEFCTDTFYLEVNAIQPSSLNLPNVFTPNNDGYNDVFQAETVAIETMEVVIFNRWGKIVYEITEPAGYWNGEHKSGGNCADGTYYYVLNARGYDGVEYEMNGTVTLLR